MKKNAPIVLLLHYVFLNTEVVKGVLSLNGRKRLAVQVTNTSIRASSFLTAESYSVLLIGSPFMLHFPETEWVEISKTESLVDK